MRTTWTAACALMLCAAGPLAAQQQGNGSPCGTPQHTAHMAKMMAADRLLEQKLAAVDSLKGDAKLEALAAVVRELVAQRRAMHAHMSEGMGGGMGQRPDSLAHGPGRAQRPCAGT